MDFIGRKDELKDLHSLYENPSFHLAMIYGRRRVGKTELVLKSLKESSLPHLYFQCKKTSEKDNAISLSLLAKGSLFPELPPVESMEELLRYFFLKGKEKPFILVLDEYPYLKEKLPGMDSILQSLIQTYEKESALKLVLLGSDIASMKESVGMGNSPLRGRSHYVKDLLALSYQEAALFTPHYSEEDKFFIYALFGGIPYYLAAVDEKKTPEENLLFLLLKKDAFLSNEASYVLSEVGGEDSAREVFQAIAQGNHAFGDILAHTSLKSSSALSWSLGKLMEMELIAKESPLNESSNKKAHYEISDPFLSFYYRFLYPNLSSLPLLNEETFFDLFIKNSFYSFILPKAYEILAREYLSKENKLGRIQPPFIQLGRGVYRNRIEHINGEFDVLGKTMKGWVVYECKYEKDPLSLSEIKHLEKQLQQCHLEASKLGFFSKNAAEVDAKEYAQSKAYPIRYLKDIYKND